MNTQRVQEILSTSQTIHVFYEGSSIWIENVNNSDQTALVTYNGKKINVPVSQLKEVQ